MNSYSVKQIAAMLNTNPETVRRWIRLGRLPALKDSRKEGNVVSESALNEFLSKSPKYALSANMLVSEIPTSAVVLGELFVRQLLNGERNHNEQISSETLTQLLRTERAKRTADLNIKMKTKMQLEWEIQNEEKRIAELNSLIEIIAGNESKGWLK